MSDCCAGVTLAFVNVPQGLAFSILANAPLVSGLYTACFSSFVYACLGTVQISSFGPAAVSALLTGESVALYMRSVNLTVKPTNTEEDLTARATFISTLTFTVGIIYAVFFALQMHAVLALFIKPFVSGFISGCTIHVLSKTLKIILGIQIKNHYGYFGAYKNIEELIFNIPNTHLPTLYFSLVILAILLCNMLVLKKLLAKITKFIIPVESVVLIASILVSYFLELHSHGFDVVKHIPTGLPMFSPLDPQLFKLVIPGAITVSLINYAVTFAMIMMINLNYNQASQDTFAMAMMNLICSNIQCFVSGNSMMRTVVAVNAGIKTQLATIISSFLLLLILLWAGPLFEPLPVAVLGCIIVISIGHLLIRNLKEFPKIFKMSLEDGLIWMVVFAATVILDIKIGLIIGFVLALRQILIKYLRQKEDQEKMKTEEEEGQAKEQENVTPAVTSPERN
ncbi:hypothetical protein GE061_014151 [Apolygus lucorum]|uniref:SLC26A/SulP transporter domain-containing protein n=1 Tax=Apolygus lucorum TaxID=248454 RepID=A0A8S9XS40_APOLU|nr:hypothetical protein GE061_014151 [Apolygus lucorum]